MPRHFHTFLLLLTLLACSDDTTTPVDETIFHTEETITVDGRVRTYTVNLPPGYYKSSGFALVIAMHGGGGSADQFESTTLLSEKADAAGFIVVYPEGVKSTGALGARTWNAGKCCDYARDNNIDDVNFIRQLITTLTGKYKIDPKKVYATGHSNGGMLSYRLACEMPDKIAAIAVSACTMVVTTPCNPSRPMPVLHMHSKLDDRVPYLGGIGITDVYFPPVDSVLNAWSLTNACANPPLSTDKGDYTFTEWQACTGNSTLQWYLTDDGGHAWPGGLPGSDNGDTPSTAINANDLLWEFFKGHTLP